MAKRTVHMAVSGAESPWREVGKVISRALQSSNYEFDLQTHPDLANGRAVGNNVCEIGVTMATYFDWAALHEVGFAEEKFQNDKFRVIAAVNRPSWMAAGVLRSEGISTVRELSERKFPWKCLAFPNTNGLGMYADELMAGHGFNRKDVESWGGSWPGPYPITEAWVPPKPDGSPSNAKQVAERGLINGFFHHIYWTSAWARQVTTVLDMKFLKLDESVVDAVAAKYGGQKMILPAKMFPGADEDLLTLGWRHLYVYGTADTDGDLVLAVLRALEQEADRILENYHGLSYTAQMPKLRPGTQMHPAAEQYFRSKGAVAA
ncbi:MAG TPA: TAXI family TRAP transporter solute-binding subunit [Chloroflexota bacterium]